MNRKPFVALGVFIGGLVGAVCRPFVVYTFWLVGGQPVMEVTVYVVMLGSAALGLLVGTLASFIAVTARRT
jgi:hypothetical protein